MVLIAVLSVAAGAVALWGGLSPESLGSARTVDLLIILGLLLLPAATFGAVIAERRTRRHAPAERAALDSDAPIDWLETDPPAPTGPDDDRSTSRREGPGQGARTVSNRHRQPSAKRRQASAPKSS